MDDNLEKIDELESEIKDNQLEIKQIYLSIGEKVILPEFSPSLDEESKNKLSRIDSVEKEMNDVQTKLKDLKNSFSRIEEITDREKEIGELYNSIENENKKLYVLLGEVAYRHWKKNPTALFSKVMSIIEDLDNQNADLEDQIDQLQNDESQKKIMSTFKNKVKITILYSRKKRGQSNLNNQFKKAGEKIYKNDVSYFENMNTDSVKQFIENRKKLDGLDLEIKSLKEETHRLEKYLKNTFSSRKQKKAEEKLNSELEFLLSEKMHNISDIGKNSFEKKVFEDGQLNILFGDIDTYLLNNNKLQKEIDLCKAQLEIIKFDEEILDMQNNVSELEVTISKCNSDIIEFNNEIKRAKSEIKKLKKLNNTNPE